MTRTACISLWQPWASLLMSGVKLHETRTWSPPIKLLGERIIIHSAKRPILFQKLSDELIEVIRGLDLSPPGLPLARDVWPLGKALGTAELISFDRTERITPGHTDHAAGDWTPGRYAWLFDNRTPFSEPRPMRGQQGIYYREEMA